MITLKLFGAFKVMGKTLSLPINSGETISDVRLALLNYMTTDDLLNTKEVIRYQDLLKISRFSNDEVILSESHLLNSGDIIAILPPVSGG